MSSIKEFDHLKIPLQDLKSTTDNFSVNNLIGRGGFGKVYKGELLMSKVLTTVAIKRLDNTLGQGAPEFWKEIMMLSRYKHENLVSLLGFCDESDEKILVYEYLPNKSLDLCLNSNDLSWIQRLRICIGAARGLQYLHDPDGTQQRVLHRDIKSSNILLDQNWKAKISDFGLSKFGPANQQFTFLVSNGVGTIGYCDPLYLNTGFLTKESDVYSFGVVLFEVLCGRLCVQTYKDIRPFLARLAQQHYEEKKLDMIIDGNLKEQISTKCLETFSTIAYQCLQIDRVKRPSMTEIVRELEIALKYQIKENLENGQLLEMEDSALWFSSLHDNYISSRGEGETDIRYYEILWEDLKIREQLHQDSNGTVYHALWYGSDVAVKLFERQAYPDDVILSFKKEVSHTKKILHPNILLFIGAVISPHRLCIVTEFLPRRSLFQILHRNKTRLDWRHRLHMAMDIAQGMNYLHNCKPPIVHRDLKSSNLLVDKNWTVKVGDFGLTGIKQQLYELADLQILPPQWMAPEILRNEPVAEPADVYSYGMVLWEITTEKIPWDNLHPLQVVGAVGFMCQRPDIPKDVDPLWASLITSCWCNEPSSRPTFKEILNTLKSLQLKIKAE